VQKRCYEAIRSNKDFAMQNCFVENLKSMTFLSKRFNLSLVICKTIFFADRTELIPLIYRKYCIRYNIFKHNAQSISGALRISNRAATAFKRLTAAGI
jgi:hypothetical protein